MILNEILSGISLDEKRVRIGMNFKLKNIKNDNSDDI